MSDNNSLNEKYQKFEPAEEALADLAEETEKPEKEKKKKESKASREKKIKEPKEKKIKEPKEKKAKRSKEKKNKKLIGQKSEDGKISLPDNAENKEINEKFAKAYETALQEEKAEEQFVPENTASEEKSFAQDGRLREEIVFESKLSPSDKEEKPKKDKNAKTEKAHNKIKEAKENKMKEPKPPKPPKAKKTQKEKPKKEKKQREPLQKKDIATIAVSAVAVILIACTAFFAYFNSRTDEKKIELVSKITFLGKIFPQYVVDSGKDSPENEKNKISEIQIARDGIFANLMQTDFPGIFYGINSDYTVQYYQYSDNRIVPVKYTDTIDLKVDMGSGILNVKMNYIKSGEYVSGIGIFTSNNNDTNYFYDLVVFKLTVLPAKYNREGHALLLASADKAALENSNVLWTESFDVNLKNGSMTRFLSVINRTIDEKGAGVSDFCMLNKAGYMAASQKVPFITSRKYPVGAGLQDIFVKNGNKEELLASDIYGKYLTVDSSKVIYLRKTTTGFDVIHNANGEEHVERSFYGFIDSNYMLNDKYLLSKEDGHLYNIASGKDYSLVGYSMNAASFIVSSDNRYVVMMGTVKNAVDYQIHIFDLHTGEYAKFKDNNYAPHGTLCFIDEKTVLYTAVEPNQGFEYVVIDVQKAFNKSR